MNFYDFCLLSEKTVYDAIANKDKYLNAYLQDDGSFDFSHEKTDDYVGQVVFNNIEMHDDKGIASVEPALKYIPRDGMNAKSANAMKIDLFHLARDKSDSRADQIYKNEFYSATVYKTVSLVKDFNPDLVVYIDSTSPFNRDVIAQLHQVNVKSINSIASAKPLKKRTYEFIKQELDKNPTHISQFVVTKNLVKETDKTRGQIAAIALQRVIQNLASGKTYTADGRTITINSPLSRQITAAMIAQEWKEAAKILAAERKKNLGNELTKSDYTIGTDLSKVLELLTSYGHFDATEFRQQTDSKEIKKIAVIDDNINSCSTYDEVNRILKVLDQTKNARIKWIVGIMENPSETSTRCFYKKRR